MNMISTGSFLTETGASNKQSELVKKLTAAWEKKNSKTARAGGASLMALSLAACGGEDNTPFSQADVDAAKTDGIAEGKSAILGDYADVDALIASNDATIAADAKAEILGDYADVDALIASDNEAVIKAAVDAALTDPATDTEYANITEAMKAAEDKDVSEAVAAAEEAILGDYANAQELIESNDATVAANAKADAEAELVAGSGFASVAELLAAYNDATGAPTPLSYAVKSTDGVISGFTSGADSVTATTATYSNAIVMVDAHTGDADSFTLTATADDDLDGTIAGIETVNVTIDYNSDADDTFTTSLSGVAEGTTVNFNHVAGSSVSAVAVTNAKSSTLNFSTLHKDVDVAGTNNSDLTIDLASTSETADSVLTVTGATVDALTITSGGDLDLDGSTNDGVLTVTSAGDADITAIAATSAVVTSEDEAAITSMTAVEELTLSSTGTAAAASTIVAAAALETVNLSGNGAANYVEVTATGAAITTVNISGDQDVELVVSGADHDSAASALTVTDTSTGTSTINFSAVSVDDLNTTAIAADQIQLSADFTTETITYASGQTFLVSESQDAGGSTTFTASVATAATNVLNIVADDDDATTTTAQTIEFDALTTTNTKTVNLSSTLDNITIDTGIDVGTATLVVSSAGTFANNTTDTTVAAEIDASATVGAVTYFTDGGVATIKTGDAGDTIWVQTASTAGVTIHTNAGDDTINAITAESYTIDGGDGVDTVAFAASADLTADTLDLSNVEVVDIDAVALGGGAVDAAVTLEVNSSDVTGDTYRLISTEDDTNDVFDVTVNGSVVDLSGINVEAAVIDMVIDATAYTAANSTVITGTNDADTITIDGGTGSEANGGGGADDITGGAGADTIRGDGGDDGNLDGAGGADTIVGGEGSDTVIGGAGSDTIDLTEETAATDTVDMTGHDTVDTIVGFATGTSNGDLVQISIAGITAGAINEIDDPTNDAGNGDASVFTTVSAAFDADDFTAAGTNVLVIDTNVGTASALEDALEDGGSLEMTFGGNFAIGDSFMVLYDDGVNSYLASVTGAGAVADGETATAGELTVANEIIFSGISDATDFATANIEFIT